MKKVMVKRQATSTTVLAGVIETLLLDISGTLNNVISGLGLSELFAFNWFHPHDRLVGCKEMFR